MITTIDETNEEAWIDEAGLDWSDGPSEFLWVDLETTGLNDRTDVVLECAAILTDRWGDITATPVQFFMRNEEGNHYEQAILRAKANMAWAGLHANNNLLKDYFEGEKLSPERAVGELGGLLGLVEDASQILLAGSSISFDKGFLTSQMPDVLDMIHYRVVDTSSVKELCRRLNPDLYAKLDDATTPTKMHRSLPDLVDSIHEYKFYVDNFLFVPGEA